jgi:transcriptional regulator with XRE-family HTH domain
MTPQELISWRKKEGISQAKLAKMLDKATLTIIRWEKGQSRIPADLAAQLAPLGKAASDPWMTPALAGDYYKKRKASISYERLDIHPGCMIDGEYGPLAEPEPRPGGASRMNARMSALGPEKYPLHQAWKDKKIAEQNARRLKNHPDESERHLIFGQDPIPPIITQPLPLGPPDPMGGVLWQEEEDD